MTVIHKFVYVLAYAFITLGGIYGTVPDSALTIVLVAGVCFSLGIRVFATAIGFDMNAREIFHPIMIMFLVSTMVATMFAIVLGFLGSYQASSLQSYGSVSLIVNAVFVYVGAFMLPLILLAKK